MRNPKPQFEEFKITDLLAESYVTPQTAKGDRKWLNGDHHNFLTPLPQWLASRTSAIQLRNFRWPLQSDSVYH